METGAHGGRSNIAIIGCGAAGLAAAYFLRGRHSIRMFEREQRVGGHIYPVRLCPSEGPELDIDIAFAFFVRENYPMFSTLLDELGVETQHFEGRLSIWDQARGFGFRRADLRKRMPPQLSPRFAGDGERFLAYAARLQAGAGDEGDSSLEDFFRAEDYDADAVRYTIVPFIATFWGFDWRTMMSLSVRYTAQEIDRLWRSVKAFHSGTGGVEVIAPSTRSYLDALIASIDAEIVTSSEVLRIERDGAGAVVVTTTGSQRFDAVILAVHADQALHLLDDPTDAERRWLGATKYHDVSAIIHTDVDMMPTDPTVWEHFNYVLYDGAIPVPATTWHLNQIFGFAGRPHFLTIGEVQDRVASDAIVDIVRFRHPVMTPAAFCPPGPPSASGPVHFCGSYLGNGSHEAAIASAKRVSERLLAPEWSFAHA
jgi:uncharacterized protein